jgi:hypothetical protein
VDLDSIRLPEILARAISYTSHYCLKVIRKENNTSGGQKEKIYIWKISHNNYFKHKHSEEK